MLLIYTIQISLVKKKAGAILQKTFNSFQSQSKSQFSEIAKTIFKKYSSKKTKKQREINEDGRFTPREGLNGMMHPDIIGRLEIARLPFFMATRPKDFKLCDCF